MENRTGLCIVRPLSKLWASGGADVGRSRVPILRVKISKPKREIVPSAFRLLLLCIGTRLDVGTV